VDSLNQAENIGGHHKKIADGIGARIPIRMGRSPRDVNGGTGAGLDVIAAGPDAQAALQHVPRFVIIMMKMRRGDETGRARGASWIPPFGNHKRIPNRANDLPGQRWSDDWVSHINSRTYPDRSRQWLKTTTVGGLRPFYSTFLAFVFSHLAVASGVQ
jgi:hypothetical protein